MPFIWPIQNKEFQYTNNESI